MSSPDYSQAVADILDGLGDSPTPDEVYHAVKNYSVDHVVAATASTAKAGGGGGSLPAQWQIDEDGTLNILDDNDVIRTSLTADGKLNMYRADETIVAQVTGPGEGFRIFDAAGNLVVARMSGTGFYGPGLPTAVSVPLTNAQILACFTTPITLVASPGPGKALVVTAPFIQTVGHTVGYTMAGNIGIFTNLVTEWFDASVPLAANATAFYGATASTGPFVAADLVDAPLTFAAATADPTNGDGDAIVSFVYHVVDVA